MEFEGSINLFAIAQSVNLCNAYLRCYYLQSRFNLFLLWIYQPDPSININFIGSIFAGSSGNSYYLKNSIYNNNSNSLSKFLPILEQIFAAT